MTAARDMLADDADECWCPFCGAECELGAMRVVRDSLIEWTVCLACWESEGGDDEPGEAMPIWMAEGWGE